MTPKVPLKVSYPSDVEVTVTRVFDAPRRPVFEAMTRPELVKRWLYGPEDWPLRPVLLTQELHPWNARHGGWTSQRRFVHMCRLGSGCGKAAG